MNKNDNATEQEKEIKYLNAYVKLNTLQGKKKGII